ADSARPPALPGDDRDQSLVCPPRCRTGFINAFQPGRHIPQGLKPACLLALAARLKPCPSQNPFFPKHTYETNSKTFILRRPAPGPRPPDGTCDLHSCGASNEQCYDRSPARWRPNGPPAGTS